MDTFVLNEAGEAELDEIRQFIVEHDIVEVSQVVYRVVETLWPELVPKLKPPLEMMH